MRTLDDLISWYVAAYALYDNRLDIEKHLQQMTMVDGYVADKAEVWLYIQCIKEGIVQNTVGYAEDELAARQKENQHHVEEVLCALQTNNYS